MPDPAPLNDHNFIESFGMLITIVATVLTGAITLFTMLGKIRTEIAEIKIVLKKDSEHMEKRIISLEQSVLKMKSQLNTILFALARNRITLEDTHENDDLRLDK